MNHRQPLSAAAASTMLERFAELDGQAAAIDAERQEAIAKINANADTLMLPLREELDEIEAKVSPWWSKTGHELAQGKRKSIELGGCMIGSRASRATLAIAGDLKDVVSAMTGLRWAKPFLNFTVSLNRTITLQDFDGRHGPKLLELGITRREGDDSFFVRRVDQAGTIGKT